MILLLDHVMDTLENYLKKGDPIDVENDFSPTYVVPQEKKKVVSELSSLAKQSRNNYG